MRFKTALFAIATLTWSTTAWATTPYAIDLKLNNAYSYGSLDVRVTYTAANGEFAGSGSTVTRTANASLNASMAFHDHEWKDQLHAGLMRTTEITGPVVLFTCTFDSNGGAPSAGNFTISIFDWSSSSTGNAPVVVISRIQAI